VVWFPQLQYHLPAHRGLAKIVAGVPDCSLVEMAEFLAEKADFVGSATATGLAAMADMALRRVAASPARLVAPSCRIADHLARAYGCSPALAALPTPSLLDVPAEPVSALPSRYIIYAGGIGPLGNHESLLMALARLKSQGKAFPLVLAGEETSQILAGTGHRAAYLKGLMDHLGLVPGLDVHCLGELTPGELKTAFSQSSGAILPVLSEDAALLAAGQAAELGVPLAVSDMAGPRDYMSRRGISPLWFRPGSADEIAVALTALRETSLRPPAHLADPGWDEVAQSYLTLFREQAILAALQLGGR
jgi:glycosyltransferase involved in cell wall biosynthesis